MDTHPEVEMLVEAEMKVTLKENRLMYMCGYFIKDDDWERIKSVYNKEGKWGTIWQECDGRNYIVTVEDLIDIFQEQYIDSQVVAAFTIMMRRTPDFVDTQIAGVNV